MDGFKHGISLTNIGSCRCSHSSLKLCCFICNYISVKIRQHHHSKLGPPFRVYQFSSHNVNKPVIPFYFRIFLCYLFSHRKKFAIGGFYNICLRYYSYFIDFIFPGIIKCHSYNSFSTLGSDDFKINSQVFRDIYPSFP